MSDNSGIYDYALSKVNFIESEKGILLFIYSLYEIETEDVRFFLSDTEGKNKDEKALILHPPSDRTIKIEIKDELYDKISKVNEIIVYEIDWATGTPSKSYSCFK